MPDENRHYVAYHNTERMRRTYSEGNPFRILTNKPVQRLHEGTVWLVAGEGKEPRRFSLGSVFRVAETGNASEEGFKFFAAGHGHLFEPSIPLNDLEWFSGFKQAMNSFQFGVQPLSNQQYITELIGLASHTGASLS